MSLEDDASSLPASTLDIVVDAVVRLAKRSPPGNVDGVAFVRKVLPLSGSRLHIALLIEHVLERRRRGGGRRHDLFFGLGVGLGGELDLLIFFGLLVLVAADSSVDGGLGPATPNQSRPLEHGKLKSEVIGDLLNLLLGVVVPIVIGSERIGGARKLEFAELGSYPSGLGRVVPRLVVVDDVDEGPVGEPGGCLECGVEVEGIEFDDAGAAVVGAGGGDGRARHRHRRGRVSARDGLERLGLPDAESASHGVLFCWCCLVCLLVGFPEHHRSGVVGGYVVVMWKSKLLYEGSELSSLL